MTKKRRINFLLFIFMTLLLSSLAGAACVTYKPVNPIEGISVNAVLHIERNTLSFARGMDIDSVDVIVKCGVTLDDNEGGSVDVTASLLNGGQVSYESFELETAGRGKRIALTYNGNSNYIFYDVIDYTVNFYDDKSGETPFSSVPASAYLNDELDLSVYVDMENYNYSTDDRAKAENLNKAMRFNGWHDVSDNLVTGIYAVSAPATGSTKEVNFYADFLTDAQFADLKLSYDGRGRRVFSGYVGADTEECVIPEGVTFVDLKAIFSASPNVTATGFEKLHIPSTARMDLPLTKELNTIGLKSITVDKGNRVYASYNGALYSEDFTSLYFMPSSNENDEFHESLTEFARASCSYWQVRALTLPDGITTLQHRCFAYSRLMRVEGLTPAITQMTGVFLGTPMEGVRDGDKALYTLVSDEGQNKYILSMILDKDMTEYTLLEGTVGIAGDAFNGCTKLVSVNLGDEVESIGGSAFSGCTSLKEIGLPSALKYLGSSVFYGCTSLTSVTGLSDLEDITFINEEGTYPHTLPNRLFYNCSKLSDVRLPSGLQKIGNSAFLGCSQLTSITLPDEVEEIGSSAFTGCGITSLTLPSRLKKLGDGAFSTSKLESINLLACENLTELPDSCFESTHLTSVTIPSRIKKIPLKCFYLIEELTYVSMDGVTEIGERAFAYCGVLTTINFGNDLETIGLRAFAYCTSLGEVELPDSVVDVGGYVFQACTSLTRLRIGSKVRTFGVTVLGKDGVFGTVQPVVYSCTALREISVSEINTNFASIDGVLYANMIGDVSFGKNGVLLAVPCAYPKTSLTVENTVKIITPYALHFSANLTTVVLQEGLENIGKGAFYGSEKLQSLSLPSTVKIIGASILLDCTAIKEFKIAPGGVFSSDGDLIYKDDTLIMYLGLSDSVYVDCKYVESAVFMNKKSLQSAELSDKVISLGDKAFSGCESLTSLKIGSSLTTIGDQAFAGLKSLEEITVVGNDNFEVENNVLYGDGGKKVILAAACNGMTSLSIRSGVTEIGNYAFAYNKTLNNIRLPQGVKRIGQYAFYDCRALEYFYAAESLEVIDNRAFSFATSINPSDTTETRCCDTLKKVMLYGGITKIGDHVFYGQYGIKQVFFKMTPTETSELIENSGVNIIFLTQGCQIGTSHDFYNPIKRYIYTDEEPVENYNGYGWFELDENGEPQPLAEEE